MSQTGISEAMRWDAQFRNVFPNYPPAVVTDDLVGFSTIGGFPATVQYQGGDHWKITPDFVPGQAVWWHEEEHRMFRRVLDRVGNQHGKELVKAAFVARGADPALVDADENLATEQMASFLPEAFGYGHGGYPHPCPSVPVPVAQIQAFFRSMETWTPPVSPQILPPIQRAIEWQGPVPSSNFTTGRGGNSISLIVDHWMATTFDGAIAHFMNGGAQVSAHYLISQQGRIVQLVRDEDTGYHCGNWTLNQQSIGIEHEGGPNLPPFPDALYAASAWLHHKLSLDYGIRLVVGETVRRHSTVVPTACPGTLDLDRIVREAGGQEDDMTSEEVIALIEAKWGLTNTVAALKEVLERQAHHKHDVPTSTTAEPK